MLKAWDPDSHTSEKHQPAPPQEGCQTLNSASVPPLSSVTQRRATGLLSTAASVGHSRLSGEGKAMVRWGLVCGPAAHPAQGKGQVTRGKDASEGPGKDHQACGGSGQGVSQPGKESAGTSNVSALRGRQRAEKGVPCPRPGPGRGDPRVRRGKNKGVATAFVTWGDRWAFLGPGSWSLFISEARLPSKCPHSPERFPAYPPTRRPFPARSREQSE